MSVRRGCQCVPHTDPGYILTYDELLKDLYEAYREARSHKTYTTNEIEFELFHDLNLRALANRIINRTYSPNGGVAFISQKPTIREIFGATFVDRVVHHYLYDKIYDFIDCRLDPDSYSCRIGKGTDYGIKRLQHHAALVSENFTKEAWVYKFDLSGYFMSIDRNKLLSLTNAWLEKQYPLGKVRGQERRSEEFDLVRYLWSEIIMDNPIKKANPRGDLDLWYELPWSKSLFMQRENVGMVIGNLSSQLLSNIFLDQLDRFMRFQLGYAHYGRYVDDFYIVVGKDQLRKADADIPRIKNYLLSLGLQLNMNKFRRYKVSQGVPFLGKVIYPRHIQVGRRIRTNYYYALEGLLNFGDSPDSILSYRGFFMHSNSKSMQAKMRGILSSERGN